jgi:hypothetical protein
LVNDFVVVGLQANTNSLLARYWLFGVCHG